MNTNNYEINIIKERYEAPRWKRNFASNAFILFFGLNVLLFLADCFIEQKAFENFVNWSFVLLAGAILFRILFRVFFVPLESITYKISGISDLFDDKDAFRFSSPLLRGISDSRLSELVAGFFFLVSVYPDLLFVSRPLIVLYCLTILFGLGLYFFSVKWRVVVMTFDGVLIPTIIFFLVFAYKPFVWEFGPEDSDSFFEKPEYVTSIRATAHFNENTKIFNSSFSDRIEPEDVRIHFKVSRMFYLPDEVDIDRYGYYEPLYMTKGNDTIVFQSGNYSYYDRTGEAFDGKRTWYFKVE